MLLQLLLVRLLLAQDLPSSTGFLGALQGALGAWAVGRTGHRAGIYALAVSEQVAASGSKDGAILTWNLTSLDPTPGGHGGPWGLGRGGPRPWEGSGLSA